MRRAISMVLLCVSCTTWQRQPVPIAGPELAGREVRVTRTDGAVYTLREARIEGDSLFGVSIDAAARVAIATSDIRTLDAREFSAARTAGLSAGVIVGIVAVVGVLAAVALIGALGGGGY